MGVISCGTTMLDEGVFENIGSVSWDTTAKTAGFTAVSGNGYFVNTTSGAVTVTLPATPSAGDIVGIKDYANTADTNNITIARNGSNIQGTANDFVIDTEGRSLFLVYVDATKGWLATGSSKNSDIVGPLFVTATGGTITCCGDYKIHTFTGPGTFTVTCAGNPAGSNSVDYMVVAGGGGGGAGPNSTPQARHAGAGGGGGFRESSGTASGCYTTSPLGACVSALPVSAQGYPITVGAGGAKGCGTNADGSDGSPSGFSTITSAGGGHGENGGGGGPGGSAGGAGHLLGGGVQTGGTGNTPPVSPPQGSNGGNSTSPIGCGGSAGGGGGALAVGSNGSAGNGGDGGSGAGTSIGPTCYGQPSGCLQYFSGGGGGGGRNSIGCGGLGGGAGFPSPGTICASSNTGGGGGGRGGNAPTGSPFPGGSGGSGIVVIRYKYQ